MIRGQRNVTIAGFRALRNTLTSHLFLSILGHIAVEKMLLKVKLATKGLYVDRYLLRDLQTNEAPEVYRMQRLAFVVSSSPFLAIGTAHTHANKYAETFPNAVREILDNI